MSELKSYIKQLILENLNELDLSTYSRAMDDTEGYPWTINSNSDYHRQNPRALGNRKGKVNNLAKERFEQEFYKKFPKGSVSINTSNGEYSFEYFKFETNYTMYHVYFRNVNGKIPEILEFLANSQNHNGEDAIWIPRNNYNVKIMDQESINKVKQLLKYNTVWKKWNEKTQRRETPTDIA